MKLSIDTSKIHEITVGIGEWTRTEQSVRVNAQMVLPVLSALLVEHKLGISDITEISVATGPGSFTGLRVGAAIANTLGYLLDIPVNGKKKLALPVY